ncbi:MAG TPA: glucosamine-6-phosphate deaminase [Epulopiscium sp.]|nr:glucosamine-6-phosphate deaminase [Candidatus Epulonipiscium sp.]
MDIYITKDYDEMSKKAAHLLASVVKETENPILGLATGGTPLGMYTELIRMNKADEVDFSKTTAFNLDEYFPISKECDQSYDYFMKENLFNHINIDMNNIHIPNGSAKDSTMECEVYDKQVRDTGGVDMQLLGIGSNGHIAFNEPADDFPTKTQKVDLTKGTIQDNARFFEHIEDVPKQAISMGIGTIMNAKRIMLIASGAGKAGIIKEAILGKVTPRVPASILQFHKDVTIILDEEAATELLKVL